MKYELNSEIRNILVEEFRQKLNLINLTPEQWRQIDSNQIAVNCVQRIKNVLECWAYIPCCHTSGMHSPDHFHERKGICESQKANAFERFCKDLGINPETKSEIGCGWCRQYIHYRRGEGLKLFKEENP